MNKIKLHINSWAAAERKSLALYEAICNNELDEAAKLAKEVNQIFHQAEMRALSKRIKREVKRDLGQVYKRNEK